MKKLMIYVFALFSLQSICNGQINLKTNNFYIYKCENADFKYFCQYLEKQNDSLFVKNIYLKDLKIEDIEKITTCNVNIDFIDLFFDKKWRNDTLIIKNDKIYEIIEGKNILFIDKNAPVLDNDSSDFLNIELFVLEKINEDIYHFEFIEHNVSTHFAYIYDSKSWIIQYQSYDEKYNLIYSCQW